MLARVCSAAVLGYRRLSGGRRGGHHQWPALIRHGGPAARRGSGRPRAGRGGAGQRRVRLPLRRHHRQPGPRRHPQGRLRRSISPSPSASWPRAASFPMAAFAASWSPARSGLEGDLRPVRGALPMALAARAAGCRGLLLPQDNLSEAAVVQGLEVRGARTLVEVCAYLAGDSNCRRAGRSPALMARAPPGRVRLLRRPGPSRRQARARGGRGRAHNLLLIGPPGAGKTMLARRLPTILPSYDARRGPRDHQDPQRCRGAAGRPIPLRPAALPRTSPYRQRCGPHRRRVDPAPRRGQPGPRRRAVPGRAARIPPERARGAAPTTGGRRGDPQPGRREPHLPCTFHARRRHEPRPCGYFGDPVHSCRCAELDVERYRSRVSGPLLDRIDIHLEVPAVPTGISWAQARRRRAPRCASGSSSRAFVSASASGIDAGCTPMPT